MTVPTPATEAGADAVLMVHIPDTLRLADIFGASAIDRALSDVGRGVDSLVSRLLGQHEVLSRRRLDGQGRWSAHFRVSAGAFARCPQETCAAIEAAGYRLLRELLTSIFGAGTGRQVRVAVTVTPLSPSDRMLCAAGDPGDLFGRACALPSPCAHTTESFADLRTILADRSLRTLLQPIVRIGGRRPGDRRPGDREVVGYEALSRGPQGSPLERADRLFDAAAAAGCTVETELLCAELALERTRGSLPPGCFLTINLGPEALLLAADALPLRGRGEVMLELTEHLPLDQVEALSRCMPRLRALGVGLALDDTGCGFADLDTVRALRPDIVKLCITVVRNIGQGPSFDLDIAATARRLKQLGSRVLAEGVETEAQHRALSGCGIELAQGWLYGRPSLLRS